MNPRLRFWLIAVLGALLAVVVSFGLAQEAYTLAGVLAVLIAWLVLEWLGGPRPEAWALAAALAGYVLGNRGFAQISLAPRLPLLPAETALLAGIAATLLRMARRETTAIFRDALNYAILAWLTIGAGRLWVDMRAHGALALRDFATCYYALFFFLAQAMAAHAASARLLRRTLLVALGVLPLTFFLFTQFQDFFLGTLRVRGVPILFYKDDLVAAYCFAGFYLVMTTTALPWLGRLTIAAAAYASAFSINSSRAAIMGLLVAGGWWAAARRWTPWKLQAVFAPLALAGLTLGALLRDGDFKQSRAYTLYEHAASIVDFSGTGRYMSEDRRTVGDNNRFRLAWWRSVADDTIEQNPVFGLGFGYDLAERFVRTYERDLGDDFTTRSPHSVVLTVFGRMGLVGLAAFGAMVAAMAGATGRLARLARHDDDALVPLGWWSVAWVMFTSGCFGVVFEGPMGAVIFWTALGLANAQTARLLAAQTEAESVPAPAAAEPDPEPAGRSALSR